MTIVDVTSVMNTLTQIFSAILGFIADFFDTVQSQPLLMILMGTAIGYAVVGLAIHIVNVIKGKDEK